MEQLLVIFPVAIRELRLLGALIECVQIVHSALVIGIVLVEGIVFVGGELRLSESSSLGGRTHC